MWLGVGGGAEGSNPRHTPSRAPDLIEDYLLYIKRTTCDTFSRTPAYSEGRREYC